MKRSIIIILVLVFTSSVFAQNEKEIKKLFKNAESHMMWEEYSLALPIYLDIINKGWDNQNIQFSIGICYLNTNKQIKQAIPYLENAVTNVSANFKEGNYKEDRAPEEAWFFMAKAYRIDGQLDNAINAYSKYKSILDVSDVYMHDFLDLQIQSCSTAKNMMSNPVKFSSKMLDFGKSGDNYFPCVSGDEQSIVFTAYQEEKDPDFGTIFFENIYYATKEGDDWKKPKDLTSDIASDGYFSTAHLNYGGDFMVLYKNDYGNDNLYYSELEGRRWSVVEKFPKIISGRDNESHGSITKDGKTLYFVSDREGGFGEKDIWYSEKDSKGRWGNPVNIGGTVNTTFIEESVFIGDDGKTMYFASEGHNSMGGYDIFKTTKNASGEWTEPQNLGYPINTLDDDVFYMAIGDGNVAYYTAYPPGGGEQRIHRIEFPTIEKVIDVVADDISSPTDPDLSDTENANETNVPVIETKTIVVPSEYNLKGVLTLQDNKELDGSFYVHIAKPEGDVIAALSPNISTGEFRTKIKHGSYIVKAFGDGYEPIEKYIFISDTEQNPDVLTSLEMVPIAVSSGEYFTIKSVLFDYNSTKLNRDAQIEIEKLAALMEKNPSLYIEVVGNTDAHGSEEYNQQLSVRRARTVIDYIRNKGVDQSRFVAKGMGKSNFIAVNENADGSDNPEGRKLNRRVDMKVIRSNSDKITTENIYVPDELRYKENLTYTIYLMETDKPLKPSYFNSSGENIANVWMFRSELGYLYTVGKFTHKSEALTLMNVVVDAGFPDARVISSVEYNQLVQKTSSFYKSKMSEKDKKVYTIQLYALKKPIETSKIKGLNNVTQIESADGYYRYIWGEFIGKTSARQALSDVMEKGYYDAFVVELDKFRN